MYSWYETAIHRNLRFRASDFAQAAALYSLALEMAGVRRVEFAHKRIDLKGLVGNVVEGCCCAIKSGFANIFLELTVG